MKKNNDETSEGLNQIFEIINAKGDTGELREIVEQNNNSTRQDEQQQSEWKGLDLYLGFFVDKTERNVDRSSVFVDKIVCFVDTSHWIVNIWKNRMKTIEYSEDIHIKCG